MDQQLYQEMLDAFHDDHFYYYHTSNKEYSDFIDGMAWVGIMTGVAYKLRHMDLAMKGEGYLKNILAVAPDARNYAPIKVNDKWQASNNMPGFYFREKPQSYAGPFGLSYAISQGADIDNPFDVDGVAKTMTSLGLFFGVLVKHLSFLEQHINTIWLAHLHRRKRPAGTMLWMCEENPFYSYIAGKKCDAKYPDPRRYENGRNEETKKVQPLHKCKPSTWIFRRNPCDHYIKEGAPFDWAYTRIWQYVGEGLQSLL